MSSEDLVNLMLKVSFDNRKGELEKRAMQKRQSVADMNRRRVQHILGI